jgi:hypothetical protein
LVGPGESQETWLARPSEPFWLTAGTKGETMEILASTHKKQDKLAKYSNTVTSSNPSSAKVGKVWASNDV